MFPPRGLHLNGSSLIINAERIAVRFHTLFTPFSHLITVILHTPVAEKSIRQHHQIKFYMQHVFGLHT